MHKNNFSAPDVLGLYDFEAKEIMEKHGFNIKTVEVTKSVKNGWPEGGCRVIRQLASGRDVYLIVAYQKWVCEI
jgi:hypothetical protein